MGDGCWVAQLVLHKCTAHSVTVESNGPPNQKQIPVDRTLRSKGEIQTHTVRNQGLVVISSGSECPCLAAARLPRPVQRQAGGAINHLIGGELKSEPGNPGTAHSLGAGRPAPAPATQPSGAATA